MNKFIAFIDYFRQFTFLQIFTIYVRYLIGGAFVIAAFGMGKFNNHELLISSPGVSIEKLEPIQQLFRVLATSGMYWKFIGWSQVAAGFLLMTQRFAKLGAAIFFGLILNIFIITLSYNFSGTPVITGLMLLAATWLLLWDFDCLQFFFQKPNSNSIFFQRLEVYDRKYWSVIGVIMFLWILGCAGVGYRFFFQLGGSFMIGLISFAIFFIFFNKRVRIAKA
jgi:hypothetical protein